MSRRLGAVIFTSDWPHASVDPSDFGGHLVGHRDKGILAVFDNCHNAMVAMTLASREISLSAGLAFGEITYDENDPLDEGTTAFGEAIVAAARLNVICPEGSVLATSLARDHLPTLQAEDLGDAELKGIGMVSHRRFDLAECAEILAPTTVSDRVDVVALATDIVASTALLEAKGTDAAVSVHRVLAETITQTCIAGEVKLVAGDGFLIEFSSASDAIRSAVALHQAVADYSLESASVKFELRTGIAAGPAPAPEAHELEAGAEPGQIRISTAAQALAFERTSTSPLQPGPSKAAPLPAGLHGELLSSNDLPLVGRSAPIAGLEAAWNETMTGRHTVCFVTGEAGIGKSRLISTFASQRHAEGAHVLYGSSDMEMDIPFRPFVQALSPLDLPKASSALAARLKPLRPEQSDESDSNNHELVASDRADVFDAVRYLLAELGETRPVLLVMEDLHWSNSATTLLLRHLLLHADPSRVMILGTFRDDEVDRTHPLFDVLNDQQIVGRSTRIALEHLTVDETADLVAARFATVVGDRELQLAERIHGESGGLPFFTGEMLRHLSDNDPEMLDLPASVVDAINQRIGRLDAATGRMLETAAVVGQSFNVDVLAASLATPLGTLLEQLEAAERLALIRESDHIGDFQFDHALVRSALLTGISATRAAVTHQTIAEALSRIPGDHNDALAHHWRNASGPLARQQAVRHIVLAAERDAAALAWEAATIRYGEALELAGDDGVIDEHDTIAIHLARARSLRASGDSDYLTALRTTGRMARAAGLHEIIANVAISSTKPGTWFANANEPDQHLIGLCEDALSAPDLDPSLRCRVLSTLATNLAFDPDRDRRRALVDEAVQLARNVNDPDLIASALIAQHLAFWDPSTFDDRAAIIVELDRVAQRRDNPDYLFLAGFFRASRLLESGQILEAQEALASLDEPITRGRNFWFRFLVERMETAIAIASGRAGAKSLVDKLFEQSFDTQADAAGTWGAQLGGLAIQSGTFGSMVDQLVASSERSRGQGVWSCGLAIAQLDKGDRVAAQATLDALGDAPLDFMWLVSQQMIAEAAYRLGDRDRCAKTLEMLRPFAGRVGVIASGTLVYALVSRSIGEAAMGAGDTELAITSLRAAVEQADQLSWPFCQVRSRRRLLEALAPSDRASLPQEALTLAETYGFVSEAEAIAGLVGSTDGFRGKE